VGASPEDFIPDIAALYRSAPVVKE